MKVNLHSPRFLCHEVSDAHKGDKTFCPLTFCLLKFLHFTYQGLFQLWIPCRIKSVTLQGHASKLAKKVHAVLQTNQIYVANMIPQEIHKMNQPLRFVKFLIIFWQNSVEFILNFWYISDKFAGNLWGLKNADDLTQCL